MIWVILICVPMIYFYIYVKTKQNFWAKKGIKFIKPKFFLGNKEFIRSKSLAETTQEWYNTFPEERYLGQYRFLTPSLLVKDPDLIKQITVKDFDHFLDHRTAIGSDADPVWSRTLFASRGQRWRDLRSTLSPSFTSSKMRIMYTLIEECAQQFVQHFKKYDSEIIELDMKDAFSRYTNDVIATTAFGLKCDSLKDKNNEFYLTGKAASNFGGLSVVKLLIYMISPTLGRLWKVGVIPSRIANYFSRIIEDTVRTREERGIVRPDMIHLLMEARKGRQHQNEESKIDESSEWDFIKNHNKEEITIKDITSQAFLFFIAGIETVSTLLTFTFYELAINPGIQDRLRKEIRRVSGKITYESLLKMKYLDMVVSEALRKWPPAILADRKVTKGFTIQPERNGENPLHLEEGLICLLPIYAIHKDPKFYPDPEKFDPERFSDENKQRINSSAYLPFGSGPRNCIGSRFALLESKLIIFQILENFEVVPVKKTPIPVVFDVRKINVGVQGGMWLGLKKLSALNKNLI